MSAYDDMMAGRPFNGADPSLFERKAKAAEAKARLDLISNDDVPGRVEAGADLFHPDSGPALVFDPFVIQYGHVKFGAHAFVNFGATFLDSNMIEIGARTFVGPNVQFITDTHPVKPEDRINEAPVGNLWPYTPVCLAHPITVGDEVWIGAGAILMPGVTVGDGAVIGAGSIVTRDIPARMVAVGNPARVIRSVDT